MTDPRDDTTTVHTPDGALLAVREGGPAGGPPLLLLQGQATSMRWWRRLRTRFEDTYRTVTIDYRGTGDSEAPVDDWTTETFAADAAHVMTELGHPTFRVYGTSMGGRVAQHLAAEHPDRVERLALACTSPGGPLATERDDEVRRLLASPPGDERTERVLRLFYTHAWDGSADDTDLLGDGATSPAASLAHLRASYGHDAWSRLPDITAPTLVLHGTADPMVPSQNAELLEASILDSRLVLRDGGRHGFFDEFADELDLVLAPFLR
ncbi:alpha/beta fold hydrolase [Mobilicoccus pelagius]|uniref:Putative hydrolase n=1 Tax=Mobilicoccus pelagius NBRC 104925 TaxID=1089455 RepID=H5UR60_9MICO|nr:alpha/beta hydrolase [Mobilicoccus pelagius]GAB48218.1 putative hydrolase [Mobilicoccus pelagius NBRC 104925]